MELMCMLWENPPSSSSGLEYHPHTHGPLNDDDDHGIAMYHWQRNGCTSCRLTIRVDQVHENIMCMPPPFR